MTINKITQQDIERFVNPHEDDLAELNLYQHIATKSAFYPGHGTALGLVYVALKLNGEAGEFAEHVGKAMRDDELVPIQTTQIDGYIKYCACLNKQLTIERRNLLLKELGDILWYLSAAANEFGISLHEIALANLEKLRDRTERDVLQGSGDER